MEITKTSFIILLCALFLIIRTNCARRERTCTILDCRNEKDRKLRRICFDSLQLFRSISPKSRFFNTTDLIREQYQDHKDQKIWENWKDFHPEHLVPRMIISKQCSSELCVCLSKNKQNISKCDTVEGQSYNKTHYIKNINNTDILEVSVRVDIECTCYRKFKLHDIEC